MSRVDAGERITNRGSYLAPENAGAIGNEWASWRFPCNRKKGEEGGCYAGEGVPLVCVS